MKITIPNSSSANRYSWAFGYSYALSTAGFDAVIQLAQNKTIPPSIRLRMIEEQCIARKTELSNLNLTLTQAGAPITNG